MLISTWDSEYSKAIVAGILERIGEEDIELHIFNAYDDYQESGFFLKGREIYSLPEPDRYDGLIIALNTIDSLKYVSGIIERFHSHNKPMVGVDIHAENAMFCGLDNYRSMYNLVEHMITLHDCRTLNFLGGPADHEENAERYRAFCDCLEAHGIKVQKKRVFNGIFRRSSGHDAYNEWKERGVNMADAVMCANDYMALGYVEAAAKDGMTIPDYTKVTGFDNIADAQSFSPSITSVNRNRKMLGYESMDMLLDVLNGNTEYDTKFVEGYISYNESCGCDLTRDIRADYNRLLERVRRDSDVNYKQTFVRQMLNSARTAEEIPGAIEKCKEILGVNEIAVCLNRSFFEIHPDTESSGYDDEIIIYSSDGKESINRKEHLYPEKWRGRYKTFLFASLRNGDQTYGYMVMPYDEEFFIRIRHRTFLESLSLSLENINHRTIISELEGAER